ncbi:MAG: NRDE family protein [Bacteroidia bacterium]
MCTVSFIPLSTGEVITSNRDESEQRPVASAPRIEKIKGVELTYPVDPQSNGSWMVAKSNGDVAVLLNGAFEKHEKRSSYRLSRGIILLKIIKANHPIQRFHRINLDQIENFTLVLFTRAQLFECRWDGQQKHVSELDKSQPHLWSSVTLYDGTAQKQRLEWFNEWLATEKNLNLSKIIQFHQNAGDGDFRNSLVMQRDSGVSTCSITSVQCNATATSLHHYDLKKDVVYCQTLSRNSFHIKNSIRWRTIGIKLFNWEYWPMHVVYAPMYFYWFYLSLKARSFFFFNTANPLRKYGGFAMEKKSEVYASLPKSCYPNTVLFKGQTAPTDLKIELDKRSIEFPVIAKPDMGERGVGVELIYNLADLAAYSRMSRVDFLTQSYVDYPFEVGIFYHRIPGEPRGKISGIVGKELVTVIGDGVSSILSLVSSEDRYLLQLQSIYSVYGTKLHQILSKGEQKVLVPYGNHCRGAKFIDLSDKINETLVNKIDEICKHVPAFYFGRLDIKFNSWEDLNEGKKFAIIELNGAASEPTHIYDPSHSILFAWKEIARHWDLLFKISRLNKSQMALRFMGFREGIHMILSHRKYIKNMHCEKSQQA